MKKTLLFGILLSFSFASAQTFVNTTPENKKAILEEYTGVNCTFCPQGHAIANAFKNANPGNVFLINIHQGTFSTPSAGQPDFRTSFGNAIVGQSYNTAQTGFGYPAGSMNRQVFPGLSIHTGFTAMFRGNWTNAGNQVLTQSSYVNVAAQAVIDVTTNQMVVTVETYYTGNSPVATNKLNVALLQNNTKGPQTGGNMGNEYNHEHRLVHMLTGQWGTDITTTTQGSFNTQTFTYTIPAAYNSVPVELADLELVVFVTETTQKIISGNGAFPTYTGLAANDVKVKSIPTISAQCTNSITPKVSIQNLSQTPLTSLAINYNLNGETPQVYNWSGTIAPLATAIVDLPAVSYTLLPSNTLNVSIPADEDNTNNSGSATFTKAVEVATTNIVVKINLDRYGSETAWNIKNNAGVTVASSPQYFDAPTNGVYPQADINLTLPNDCYTFNITDSYGDGMCCAYGSGNYQIFADGVLVSGLTGGNFGSGENKRFGVNVPLSDANFDANAFKFYPNPTSGLLNVSLIEDATVTITDLSGKQIHSSKYSAGASTINLSSYAKGLYLINFANENGSKIEKLVLN